MEAIGDLFSFVSAIGDEISNIILGDDGIKAPEELSTQAAIRPVVVAGPSGVGKGTLINKLIADYPHAFGFSVSHTTRDIRPGEVDGVDYNFTDRASMAAMIEAGEFIESADVHGNYYGTSKRAVGSVLEQGKICVLDIDVQGVQSVKAAKVDPEPIYIFIKAPSMEALEKRLRGRATESEEKIQKRLANAVKEIAYADADSGANFDAIIMNDDLDRAYAELKEAIKETLDAIPPPPAVASDAETAAPAEAPAAAPAPSLAEQIAAKEAELAKANAAKDRAAAKALLAEIEALEAQQK
eukprot:m.300477 g.300477  ORF g.300477 m.300477 type:complete len:298 (-) comp20129_c0_seq1:2382-3275(-)